MRGPIMQVPNPIWSELVSHGADLFESGGSDQRQPFRDWNIGHASTVRLSAPRLHRFGGGQNRSAMSYLNVPRLTLNGIDRRLSVRRGFPMRPVADQLRVRTGELARKQSGSGLIGGATDLYLPGRSLIRFL